MNLWVNSRMDPYNIKVRSLSGDLSSMLLLSSCRNVKSAHVEVHSES